MAADPKVGLTRTNAAGTYLHQGLSNSILAHIIFTPLHSHLLSCGKEIRVWGIIIIILAEVVSNLRHKEQKEKANGKQKFVLPF